MEKDDSKVIVNRRVFDCLTWLVNRAAECYEYKDNWSAEFVKKEIVDVFENFKKELKEDIDWVNLSEEDLRILRFSKWELIGGRDIWLIPLYLFSQLPLGAKVWCIDGKQYINDGKSLDNDVRYGCTAYGIIPGNFEIVPEDEWEEFNKKQREENFKTFQENKLEMLIKETE